MKTPPRNLARCLTAVLAASCASSSAPPAPSARKEVTATPPAMEPRAGGAELAPVPVQGPAPLTGVSATGKWVSGYYVGYQHRAYPPSAIRWSGITHLFIGRVVPNADGSLNTTFDVDATNGPALGR